MKKLADYVEDVEGTEILSMGNALELIKDLGDAARVSSQYQAFAASRARMASAIRAWPRNPTSTSARRIPTGPIPTTTSPSSITGSSPTTGRCAASSSGAAIASCRTATREVLAVYTAYNLEQGATLEDSLRQSIQDIDGVFTYLVSTKDALGMAKDTMAAKPMVLYESDNLVALASEEVAIRERHSPRDRHLGSL